MGQRTKIVIGNWKMNGTLESVRALCSALRETIATSTGYDTTQVGVCPPFVYLSEVVGALRRSAIAVGAQDVSEVDPGAFTGDIAASMLADVGCTWVLVGHSERRSIHRESDELVGRKMMAALKNGLIPVLCVGETLEQREAGTTERVIEGQLKAVLAVNGSSAFERSVVAYEPMWAIGTGRTASPQQAQDVHAFIRNWVAQQTSEEIASDLRIQYGGSVKASNARELFSMPDIDGGLIGGASLNAVEFAAIVAAADVG